MNFSKEDLISYAAILVIVVSLASIGMQLTGYATTDSNIGIVNVTIQTSAALNFTTDRVAFGSGAVTGGTTAATLNTSSGVVNGSWTPITQGLILENIGNVNVSVNFSSNVTAATMIGGSNPSPSFQYKISDVSGEEGACEDALTTWTEFTTSAASANAEACSNLQWDANDSLELELQLVIPQNSLTGTRSAEVTATGYYV